MICGTLGCRREELYDPLALQLITGITPKPKKERETDNIRIPREITRRVDAFARKYGLSRDAAGRMMIIAGDCAMETRKEGTGCDKVDSKGVLRDIG